MFGTVTLYSQYTDNGESRLYRKKLRDASNILDIPEKRFVANFRVDKEVFLKLMDEMEPLMKMSYRSTHIPQTIKLASFLKFLATGSYLSSIGNEYFCSMSKSEVSKTISELLNISENTLCPKWIKLEKSTEEENAAKEHFYNVAGIPGIVGCVDGTHVRIKSPGDNVKHHYYNRKGFYSMNVMLICDHNMVITYVDARNPGSNHDAFVWEKSPANHYFKSNFERGKRNTCLLGDSGYKLEPYMMTPYRTPTATHEVRYNKRHCKGRNIIERVIGVTKNRFRSIIGSRGLHYSPGKATKIVNACCALHNICIFYKNEWTLPDNAHEIDDEDVGTEHNESMAATSIRNQISINLM